MDLKINLIGTKEQCQSILNRMELVGEENNMKTKELNIEAPDGYIIDQDNSDLSKGVIKFKKCEVDDRWCSWEDLKEISGYYSNTRTHIEQFEGETDSWNSNTFATKAQAEASVALAQLTQLIKHVNGDWKPDWISHELKLAITLGGGVFIIGSWVNVAQALAFRNEQDAQKFLETHRDLIKKAAPLLWGVTL